MLNRKHIFFKLSCLLTAVYVLNVSINTSDAYLYGYINTAAKASVYNEVESVLEYILEINLGNENAVPESNEPEQDGKVYGKADFISTAKSLHFYGPATVTNSSFYFLLSNYAALHKTILQPPPEV